MREIRIMSGRPNPTIADLAYAWTLRHSGMEQELTFYLEDDSRLVLSVDTLDRDGENNGHVLVAGKGHWTYDGSRKSVVVSIGDLHYDTTRRSGLVRLQQL